MENGNVLSAIIPFIKIIQERSDEWFKYIGSKYLTRRYQTQGLDKKSKFYRVLFVDGWRENETDDYEYKPSTSGSIVCFIALEDGQNKALGSYKRGDIFYPAGIKGPARGVRGNVFSEKCGAEALAPGSYNIRPLR